MAATLTLVKDSIDVMGRKTRVVYDMTPDTSYPTGGIPISAANVGLRRIEGVRVLGGNAAAAVLIYWWDTANNKLLCMFPSGGGATSPTTLANAAIASGGTAMTSAAANGANDLVPGKAVEVGNTADLSTLTVRLEFVGEP